MTLPAPSLDDRRFQDIVDEAKQRIPRYCPEWTDHNVSDPGVAIIELFAWMTELTLYRLNQVPDRMYTKFLDLLGIDLHPAQPARTDIWFWLSGPQTESVRIEAGTRVGTVRTENEPSIVFMTEEERTIVPPRLTACVTGTATGRFQDQWDQLRAETPSATVTCFGDVAPGDAFYVGFGEALGGNIIRLDVSAPITGRGVDPDDPPLAWEAWSGDEWEEAVVIRDTTRALNRNGEILLALPPRQAPLLVGPAQAHWVRCRLTSLRAGQSGYQQSPEITGLTVTGLGGIAPALHGEPVGREHLGRSTGTPSQTFTVLKRPVLDRPTDLAGAAATIGPGSETVVVSEPGLEDEVWTEVADFAYSGPDSRHFVWDGASGEIRFGPSIRQADGHFVQYGAVPRRDAEIHVTGYRHGGGRAGNVGAGTLKVLKSTIPFISRVENPEAATGGVDAETVDEAKARAPMWLRSGQRAVTGGDFERLTLEASPLVARARFLPAPDPDQPVEVLIVPRLDLEPDVIGLDDLRLRDDLVAQVRGYLDQRRLLNSTVLLRPPRYVGVMVVAQLTATEGVPDEHVRDRALRELFRYINPLTGGPEGKGWPFERNLGLGEVHSLLGAVEGVAAVGQVQLFVVDLGVANAEPQERGQQIALTDEALPMSYNHQVVIR